MWSYLRRPSLHNVGSGDSVESGTMETNRLPSIIFGLSVALAPYAQSEPTLNEPNFPPGIEITGMDRSVAPGANFFAYANGTWLRTNEIPSDRSSNGSWDVIEELVERRFADLIQHASEGEQTGGSQTRKIGDYFASFMQEAQIECLGFRPLQR